MIPPNTTLLKYDNPLLVTKNTDKKTPAVRIQRNASLSDDIASHHLSTQERGAVDTFLAFNIFTR